VPSADGDRPLIAVIGGGMSGLAAARVLAGLEPVSGAASAGSRRTAARVVVLEASDRLGGKVRTGAIAGVPVELGPDQFLRRDPSAESLCRHLGLGDDLVAPGARSAAVFSRGAMRSLPGGLVLGVPTDLDAVAASGIVSDEGVEQARKAAVVADDSAPISAAEVGLEDGDERTAGEILRPRLGEEVVDRLVDPLLGGINAGSVDHMSLGVSAPQIATALVGHSNVVGALAGLAPVPAAGGANAALTPESPFLGLCGGLGRMVDACVAELESAGVELLRDAAVTGVRRASTGGRGWQVEHTRGVLDCDGVVLALPGFAAAPLLRPALPEAADALAEIAYASVAVLTLAYPAASVPLPEGWTGVLVPRVEGLLMTAASFLSVKWPWMSSDGVQLVRVSAGRAGDDRIAEMAGDDLACELAGEFEWVLGHEAHPVEWHVTRWERSFPQYRPGHRLLVERLRRSLAADWSISIAGAALGGIGIPACITSGEAAAHHLGAGLCP
jgi:oxygen-dependent protoporphyrinogen oxidase